MYNIWATDDWLVITRVINNLKLYLQCCNFRYKHFLSRHFYRRQRYYFSEMYKPSKIINNALIIMYAFHKHLWNYFFYNNNVSWLLFIFKTNRFESNETTDVWYDLCSDIHFYFTRKIFIFKSAYTFCLIYKYIKLINLCCFRVYLTFLIIKVTFTIEYYINNIIRW